MVAFLNGEPFLGRPWNENQGRRCLGDSHLRSHENEQACSLKKLCRRKVFYLVPCPSQFRLAALSS